jgi:hypothetical protein
MADVSVSHEALSEYEKLRQANIERNEQFLKSLGVSHPVSDNSSDHTSHRHSHSHSHSHSQTRQTKSAAKKRKSDDKSFEEVPPVESRRRSRRIQQLSAEFEESKDEEGIYFIEEVPHRASTIPVQPLELTVDDAESGRVAVTAAQIQALIEKSDQNHDDLISNEVSPIIVFFVIALFTAPLFSSSCIPLTG